LDKKSLVTDLVAAIEKAISENPFPQVVRWNQTDRRRVTPVPPGHWLLLEDSTPFRATLEMRSAECRMRNEDAARHIQSIAIGNSHVAFFPPRETSADAALCL